MIGKQQPDRTLQVSHQGNNLNKENLLPGIPLAYLQCGVVVLELTLPLFIDHHLVDHWVTRQGT